jgi:hypothetical protein
MLLGKRQVNTAGSDGSTWVELRFVWYAEAVGNATYILKAKRQEHLTQQAVVAVLGVSGWLLYSVIVCKACAAIKM